MVDRYLGDIKEITDIALSQRQTEAEAGLRVNLSNREAEKIRRQDFRKKSREEWDYLKDKGIIDAFKKAADLLKPAWPDARVTVEKPEYSPNSLYSPATIVLRWNYRLVKYNGEYFHTTWEHNHVFCRVDRGENNSISGLKLNNGERISADPEIFGPKLVETIKRPRAESEWPNWTGLGRRLARAIRP